jgi:Fur family zinc uptake transcriptional regulator
MHNHKTCLHNALEKAELLCKDIGARLTPIRKQVLKLVWSNHKAIKAYDILDRLDLKDGSLKPPTVYRALDFLVKQGLVHRIESMNAFIGCAHPLNKHGCQFLICDKCNNVDEFCDDTVTKTVQNNAKQSGFAFKRQVLEVYGICRGCRE